MERKSQDIVIVGGGTAGWMTAALLKKVLADSVEIELVESDDIGIVGVGEATIPPIRLLNNVLGINEAEFLRETKATIKLAIKFEHWKTKGESYYHTFGAPGAQLGFCPFQHYWLQAKKAGLIFESGTIYDNKVPAWIDDFVRSKGYHINPKASALLAEYLGNDLSKVANELEKLMLNVPQAQEINTKEVQDNIGISKEYNVFELQNALSRRDVYKANQIVNYFEANPKANPIVLVMGNLAGYFTKILKYHYVADKSQAAKELGVNPYFLKDYELAARNYNLGKTFEVISLLREYDLKSKGVDSTGNTEHGELMKELVFKIMH